MKVKSLVQLALITLICACAPKGQVQVHTLGNPLISYDSKTEQAPVYSDKDLKSLDLAAANQIYLKIKATALGARFLMSVAQIDAPPAPAGSAMANKVVSFERRGPSLYMFESLEGKVATNNVATKVLLARFPIIESDDQWITFDLGAGLDLVYQKRALQAGEARDSEDTVLKLTHSFIDKVELRDQYIFVNQFARALVPVSETGQTKNVSIHLKYIFQSYLPSVDYKAKKTLGLDKVGYFETDKVISAGSGEENVYIMRQHPQKQITWYLKGPIPAEHRRAVIEGVLYWNQVFGSEKIKVEQLPANIGVHEPGYNIVQWLEWDTAGFAYANIHGDPLTGEVLQGHIYMTSVFGKSGVKNARKYFEQVLAGKIPTAQKESFALKGWNTAMSCEYEFQRSLAASSLKTLENISELTEQEQEAIFLRVANDYIRSVVAHEIGHALGLRHNFAGSLDTTLTAANYNEKVADYFLNDNIDPSEKIVSTVMDYTPMIVAAMTGAMIRKNQAYLAYDHTAISWGHKDQDLPNVIVPYCTDGDRGANRYHDCKIWDRFSGSIDSAYASYNDKIDSSAYALAVKIKALKKFQSDIREFFISLGLSPKEDATSFVAAVYPDIFAGLERDTRFLTVKRLLPTDSELYSDLRNTLELEYLGESFQNLGTDLGQILLGDLIPNANKVTPLRAKLEAKTLEFITQLLPQQDAATMDVIKTELKSYFFALEREVLIQFAPLMAKARFKSFDKIDWEDNLKFFSDGILFGSKDQLLDAQASVKMKTFNFKSGDKDLRSEIVKAIVAPHFGDTPSNQRTRSQTLLLTKKRHQEEVDALTPVQDRLSDQAYDYLIWEQERFAPLKSIFR